MSIPGIIGAVIGFVVAGPAGALKGFTIGSAVGSLLFPSGSKQEGPRLGDLAPQSSEYGKPIPIIYGAVGLGGNVIWASPIVEKATTTQQGGKGGGGGGSVTNYSYFGNFAVLFSEGERNIGKIWAGPDKRLVWDGANIEGGGSVRIYNGSETQLPDALIESYLGAGNVPAYRGSCYAVFEMFPLLKDGNRLPFITAEVGQPGDKPDSPVVYLGQSAHIATSQPGTAVIDPATGLIWSMELSSSSGFLNVSVNSDVTQTQVATFSVPVGNLPQMVMSSCVGSNECTSITEPSSGSVSFNTCFTVVEGGIVAVGDVFRNWQDIIVFFPSDLSTPTTASAWHYEYCPCTTTKFKVDTVHGSASPTFILYDAETDKTVVFRDGGSIGFIGMFRSPILFAEETAFGGYLGGGDYRAPTFNLGQTRVDQAFLIRCVINAVQYKFYAAVIYGTYNSIILYDPNTNQMFAKYDVNNSSGNNGDVAYDPDRQRFIVFTGSSNSTAAMVYQVVDIQAGTVTNHTIGTIDPANVPTDGTAGTLGQSVVYKNGKYVFGVSNGDPTKKSNLIIVNADTLIASSQFFYESSGTDPYLIKIPLLVPLGNKPYLLAFDQDHVKRLYFSGSNVTGTTLSRVVSDLSLRAGLTPNQYDVSPLTDVVDGYAIARQTTVRAAIDALRPAYYFDAVERSAQVAFIKRGGAIAVIIPDADLAAGEGMAAADDLIRTRQMEVELPRSLSVTYLSRATDYSSATKLAKRIVGSSVNETSLEFPLVLTDSKAQQIADVNLHLAFVQRLSFSFTLPRRYSALEPTDIVVVKGKTMLLTKITASPGGVLKVDAVADAANYYVANSTVTETPTSGKVVFIPSASQLLIL